MKNLNTITTKLTLGILFLSFITLFGLKEEVSSIETNPVEVNITVGKRCPGGRGLCAVNSPSENSRSIADATGRIHFNENGRVVLEINKSTISVAKSQEQFIDQTFVLDDDFKLPDELVAKLNVKRKTGVTLKKGTHAIQETRDKYIIVF